MTQPVSHGAAAAPPLSGITQPNPAGSRNGRTDQDMAATHGPSAVPPGGLTAQ